MPEAGFPTSSRDIENRLPCTQLPTGYRNSAASLVLRTASSIEINAGIWTCTARLSAISWMPSDGRHGATRFFCSTTRAQTGDSSCG